MVCRDVERRNVYSLLTARTPDTFATSFCRREGLEALRAPATAFDTALRIMADRVKRNRVLGLVRTEIAQTECAMHRPCATGFKRERERQII